MNRLLAVASLASLLAGLAAPFLYWHEALTESGFKQILLLSSLAWFVLATLWMTRRAGED